MPCCDASKLFEGNVSTQDATVVRNLRGEGAILLGKTNIPEFAFHYDSNNLVYGATHNPHNPERSVGGSSGGEGAALATGITPFGVGLRLRRLDPGAGPLQRRHRAEARPLGRPLRRPLPARRRRCRSSCGRRSGRWPLRRGPASCCCRSSRSRTSTTDPDVAPHRVDARSAPGPAHRDLRRGRHLPGRSRRSARRCSPPAARWPRRATRSSRSARPIRPRCARCSSRSRWPRSCRCSGR